MDGKIKIHGLMFWFACFCMVAVLSGVEFDLNEMPSKLTEIPSSDESGMTLGTVLRLRTEFKKTFRLFSSIIEERDPSRVYELSSREFRDMVTQGFFLANSKDSSIKGGYKTRAILGHYECVYDSELGKGFMCIAIVREELLPPGKPRFVAMTWVYGEEKQEWRYLNLPFVEFLPLPLKARLRW